MLLTRLHLAIIGALAAILLVVSVVQTVRLHGFLWVDGALDELADTRRDLNEARAGRIADRREYEQAQADAQAKNRADVERIKSEQEKISADQKSKYERDLARLRAGGLRPEFAAPPGSPGKPGTGPDAVATCRADEQNVCVPRTVLVQAGEIELARNALIDWINEQLKVAR
jgi:hypothetical protein